MKPVTKKTLEQALEELSLIDREMHVRSMRLRLRMYQECDRLGRIDYPTNKIIRKYNHLILMLGDKYARRDLM